MDSSQQIFRPIGRLFLTSFRVKMNTLRKPMFLVKNHEESFWQFFPRARILPFSIIYRWGKFQANRSYHLLDLKIMKKQGVPFKLGIPRRYLTMTISYMRLMQLMNSFTWRQTFFAISYVRWALQNGINLYSNGAKHLGTVPRKRIIVDMGGHLDASCFSLYLVFLLGKKSTLVNCTLGQHDNPDFATASSP